MAKQKYSYAAYCREIGQKVKYPIQPDQNHAHQAWVKQKKIKELITTLVILGVFIIIFSQLN